MPFNIRKAGAVIAATAVLAAVGLATPAYAAPKDTAEELTKAVTVNAVLGHLRQLQNVSDSYGGNRAAGQPGYAASVNYVVRELRRAGYQPQVQEFAYVDYANSTLTREDPATEWVYGRDFLENAFDTGTPVGTATGPLTLVDLVTPPPGTLGSTSGCEAADFADFVAGSIALVQRGTCGFAVKAVNAQAAGASAVIVMNNGQPGLVRMIGDASGLTIPAIFVTTEVGLSLASAPDAQVTVNLESNRTVSYNVLAETGTGDDSNVVMAGAHLDSVLEGPGINDNGSGSAALLETAIQMKKVKPTNTVRFAWWGAEEEGLLGSTYYVGTLTQEQQDSISLYLNFDMVGSPNYVFGVYDGDQSDIPAPVPVPDGSQRIEAVFKSYFAQRGFFSSATEFSGRSDYAGFIAAGIPAGGLFTGAEGIKTVDEAAKYGGVAGVAYDPCYHQACDNLTGAGRDTAVYDQLKRLRGNINRFALDVNSDAIAAAVITFAFDLTGIPERVAAPGARSFGGGVDLDALRDRYAE